MAAPITLSYAEFLKTPFGSQGRAGYNRYLSYIKRRRSQPRPTSVPANSPYAAGLGHPNVQGGVVRPTATPTPMAPIVRGPVPKAQAPNPYAGIPAGLLPSKWDPNAVMSMLTQAYGPMFDYINRIYQEGLYAAGQATTGYTQALQGEYSPLAERIARDWGAQSASAQGANTAMQAGNKAQTKGNVGPLSNYAGLSGAGNQIVADASARGAQVGKTLAVLHDAQYQDLLSGAAAQKDLVSALPGIATLRGMANLRDYTLQSTKSRDDQIAQLNAQIASALPGLYGQYQDRETQKALGVLAYGGANQRAATSAAASVARTTIQTQAQWRRTQAQITAARNRALTAQRNRNALAYQSSLVQLSKLYKQPVIGITKNGVPIGINGPITKVPTTTRPPSQTAIANRQASDLKTATTMANVALHGTTTGAPLKSGQTSSILGAAGIGAGGPGPFQPMPFKQAYSRVFSYLRGRGYSALMAKRLALYALGAAGYPVRTDLLPAV